MMLAFVALFVASAVAQTANPAVPFTIRPGEPLCCCYTHPIGRPCIPGWPVAFCQGTGINSFKRCETPAPTAPPTTRAPTPFPTTRAPTPRPTRRPTPQPTRGPVCDCLFDPKLPPLPAFPIHICEGVNSHRCVCVGCDYTFNRQDCVEWVQFDIQVDTFWSKENTYLIKGEVHVCDGARLTIEPGTVVLFEDWEVRTLLDEPRAPHTTSWWSVLVVESLSSIDAQEVSFEGKSHAATQLNGGVVIAGTAASINVDVSNQGTPTKGTFSIRSVASTRVHRRSILHNVRFVNLGGHGFGLAALNFIGTDNTDVDARGIFIGNAGGMGFWAAANSADITGLTSDADWTAFRVSNGSDFDVRKHLQAKSVFGRAASIDTGSIVRLPGRDINGQYQGRWPDYEGTWVSWLDNEGTNVAEFRTVSSSLNGVL